ncbi:TIGR00282 family metallophosphoesterase [Sneathiella chinensis]|uniref:Metallophosphoesterase n=1 Tax=Sneathiella chinensis TaxID=349750 RepID=A0ABQ5U4J1_9PROT|nr:TIGR00282 family metallophosphoesterase [Sneathiella chinensis]GLQ06321.1 metallophosphoesterase [Sneathiella chinensis]
MRLLYCGDVVGRSGRDVVLERMPEIRERLGIDFAVVNGENSASGFGITEKICAAFYETGTDCIVLGNHSFDQKDIVSYMETDKRLIRPANYPEGTPGRGAAVFKTRAGKTIMVIQVMGRVFMDPLEDPFAAVDRLLATGRLGQKYDFILVDIHGEATSEKMAMGHFCDGRVSAVVGSHSHVPTADAQILPGGTAYQTDAGMCGDYNSVIGMDKEEPIRRFTRKIPGGRFTPALGDATLCGIFVETDDATGLATRVAPVRLGGRLAECWPDV